MIREVSAAQGAVIGFVFWLIGRVQLAEAVPGDVCKRDCDEPHTLSPVHIRSNKASVVSLLGQKKKIPALLECEHFYLRMIGSHGANHTSQGHIVTVTG